MEHIKMDLIFPITILIVCPLIHSLNFNLKEPSYGTKPNLDSMDSYQLVGEFKDYCTSARDCREHAYMCNRNSCDCASGYKIDEKNKTCVGGIGTKCHYDTHCIENAFCRHQLMCFCKKDYYPSDDHWTCIGEWESNAMIREVNFIMLITIVIGLSIAFN